MRERDAIRGPRGGEAWLWVAAVIPGLGHLLVGRTRQGLHLLVFAALLVLTLLGRWDAFLEALSARGAGEWIASRFLLVALAGTIIYSIWHLRRQLLRRRSGGKPRDWTAARSPLEMALQRFRENRLALVAVYVIALLAVTAVLAPILAPYDPTAVENISETQYLAPSWTHPFGTDKFGRDLLTRSLFGARVSLSIGLFAMLIAAAFGTTYGAVAGYFGGMLDEILMRLVDVLLAFPTIFLLLTLVGVFEADILTLILLLGFTSWTGTARFIRGEVLSLKEREFIEGARVLGLPDRTIILRHLIPNAMAPVLVNAALMVGGMITAEAALSFLGLGVQPPTPSWGQMINQGQEALVRAWWVAVFPGGLLALTVLCFNLLADGFRDALDPKTLMRKYV